MESNTNKRTYWLDGFEGAVKNVGILSRSEIAVDVNRLESKFNVNIVAISIENDIETGKPSYNIKFITEVNEDEFIRRGNTNES